MKLFTALILILVARIAPTHADDLSLPSKGSATEKLVSALCPTAKDAKSCPTTVKYYSFEMDENPLKLIVTTCQMETFDARTPECLTAGKDYILKNLANDHSTQALRASFEKCDSYWKVSKGQIPKDEPRRTRYEICLESGFHSSANLPAESLNIPATFK